MNRVCLLMAFFCLIGCSTPDSPPAFEITVPSQTDQVTSESSDGSVRFDIHSESGIGSAEVNLAGGQWPEEILLRVHAKGLESFKFSYADTVIEVSVATGSDQKVLRSAMQIGKDLQPAGEGTKFYMPLKADEAGNWIELQCPANFHELAPSGFRIDWIDFYR